MALSVLQVLSQDLVGGAEAIVTLTARRLAETGVDSRVATYDAPGPVARELTGRGVPVYALGRSRLLAGPRLARLVRREDFDVVEVYGFKASVIARLSWPRRAQARLVHCVTGAHITEVLDFSQPKGRFALLVERTLSSRVDAYDVISRDAIELLARHGIERERMHYIPNGIDLSGWPFRPAPPDGGPPTILCSARFVDRKRQEDLIRAVAILAERSVDCRLELLGEGPKEGEVRRLAADLGVGDRTDFPGALAPDQVRRRLERASVFCLPSLWEGQPAAAIEAMAVGVPVVITDTPGTRELIDDGRNGLLIPARDPLAVADAVERLLADPGAAASMAAAARRRVEERHSLEAMVEGKRELFERLVADRA
jgi:glycosyltransferase involved in cell wall biosynthesis